MSEPIREAETSAPPGIPLWAKVLGIVLIVIVIVVGIAMLSGGEHGPGRHLPSSDAESSTAYQL